MAKEKDLTQTRLENITADLRSVSTCTSSTVTELQALLSVESAQSQKENIRAKGTKATAAQTAARRRPGTATAIHADNGSAAILPLRERYVLATEAANATLKSLTDALKPQAQPRKAQAPSKTKPPTTTATDAKKAQRPQPARSKSSCASQYPLKERSASQVNNSPTKPKSLRRSSSYSTFSGPDSGLVATAECARVALAYLSTTEAIKFAGKDSQELELENGRLSLVGKLVSHGLDNLAVKEMRILKRRLEKYISRHTEAGVDKAATSRPASQQGPSTEKETESLASLLDYGDLDYNNAAVPIIINLQIYALRVIARIKRPRIVEATWNYLKLSYHSNPANLISHLAKLKDHRAKAARQLESLAQAILQLCPSISSSADEEQLQPSPDIVLCLQHLAFGVRKRWWVLAEHKGNEEKELIEPFGKCIMAFARRSTLPAMKKYRLAESLYSNLVGAGSNTDFSQRDGTSLSGLKNLTLASLARAAGLPDEALRWLGSSSSPTPEESTAAATVRYVRMATVSLEACVKNGSISDQDETVHTALGGLSGRLDGTVKELDSLLVEVHALRRVASHIILASSAENLELSPMLQQQCLHLVAASVRFSTRFIGRKPLGDESAKALASYQARLTIAGKVVKSTVDSVAACCKLPFSSHETWAELDTMIQDCMGFVSQIEEGNSSASSTSPSPYVKFSNSYWVLHRQLGKLDPKSLPVLTAMQRSTELLQSRSQEEKEAGQLIYKLERLGEVSDGFGHVEESRNAFAQCIYASLDDGLAQILSDAAASHNVKHVFKSSQSLSDLSRTLRLHHRSFADHGLGSPGELAFFDDCKYTAAVRGVILEWQLMLYQHTLSKHRAWNATLNPSIQTMADRLLSIYVPAQFPIRRQRLYLLLLQLSHLHPDIISKAYVSDNCQPKINTDILKTEDRDLSRFGDHFNALLTLRGSLQEGNLANEKLREPFGSWQCMLDSARSWEDVAERIDDADHWLEAIQASVDLLCAKGEEYEALPVLHLLVRALELQSSSESSQLVMALCALGLQFLRLGYSGKAGLAFAKAELLLSKKSASTEAKLRWHLAYAEYLLSIGNVTKCESTLSAAEVLAREDAQFMDLAKPSTSLSGRTIFNRVVAEACYVSSLLCSKKGDHKNAARYARQSVLLNRRIWAALEGVSNSRKAASAELDSEGSLARSFDPLSSMRDDKGAPLTSSVTHEALKGPDFWSLIPPLYRAITQHSAVIVSQGLLEEAVYVLQQAQKVASAIDSCTMLMDNASRLADLWIQSGRPDKAQPLLEPLDPSSCGKHLSVVTFHMSIARMQHASRKFEDEDISYDTLETLVNSLSSPSHLLSLESFTSSVDVLAREVSGLILEEPRPGAAKPARISKTRSTAVKAMPKTVAKSTSRTTRKAPLKSSPTVVSRTQKKATASPPTEEHSISEECAALDALKADITYRRVATHLLQGDVVKALNVLSKVAVQNLDRDGSHAWVHFKTMLAQAIKSIAEDFTFNTLPESTIAFPSIPQKDRRSSEGVATKRPVMKSTTKTSRAKKEVGDNFVELIQSAREKLVEAHAQHATAASNHVFRQLSAALSHATVLLSAVSQGRIRGSIHPLYSAYMSEIPKHYALTLAQDSIQVDQETMPREVYLQWPKPTQNQSSLASLADFQHDYIDILPETWNVVSLALSEEQDEIYITRYEKGTSPFVLRLPLARHSSRDLDEEEFTFGDGRREFEEIIELSDFTTRGAKDLNTTQGKKQWWEDRQALDTKLRELLLNIENIWLGGFKGIFSDHIHQPALLARFRKSFDNILTRHLPSRQKKGPQKKTSLDPRVLELFIGLGDASNGELDVDEALTDLIYFVVDILQFNGEPNAYDEIDFDAMVIETHDALRAYHENAQTAPPGATHTILILDKNLHMIPWESLPCLERLSISRLPSLAALRERLLAARLPTTTPDAPAGHYISAAAGGTSMLNPSGDLSHTSKIMKPHLDLMQGPWTHIANRAPSEKEFEDSLKNEQLVLFIGHGSGAQYIRSKVVRRLYLNAKTEEGGKRKPGCATTFLFGCSSVHLSDNGIYEPSGMLASYLTAGAPAVLGMLWDVTDKDCDRLAVKAGELWGLWPEAVPESEGAVEPPPTVQKRKGKGRVAQLVEEVETPRAARGKGKGKAVNAGEGGSTENMEKRRRGIGLDEAVKEARSACKLRYLNGAAAVVYGIPVYLE